MQRYEPALIGTAFMGMVEIEQGRYTLYSDAEAVEREKDSADERARMLNFQKEKLEAALSAAQGEVERMRVAIEAGVCLADFVAGERDMDKCEDCQVSECCSCCSIVAGRFLKKVPHDVAMEIAAQAQEAFGGKP